MLISVVTVVLGGEIRPEIFAFVKSQREKIPGTFCSATGMGSGMLRDGHSGPELLLLWVW